MRIDRELRKKLLLTVLIFLILYIFVYVKIDAFWQERNAYFESLDSAYKKIIKEINYIHIFSELHTSLKNEIIDLRKLIMPLDRRESGIPGVFARIEKLSDWANVSLLNFKPLKASRGDIRVSFTIDAPFENFMKFLYKLETDPYIFHIERLLIANESSTQGNIKANIIMLSYTGPLFKYKEERI